MGGMCNQLEGCSFKNLSCRYLQHLNNNTIVQVPYSTVEDAIGAVKSGDAWGALYFTENFTDAMVARMALGTIICQTSYNIKNIII